VVVEVGMAKVVHCSDGDHDVDSKLRDQPLPGADADLHHLKSRASHDRGVRSLE